jgi:hypothetical protein
MAAIAAAWGVGVIDLGGQAVSPAWAQEAQPTPEDLEKARAAFMRGAERTEEKDWVAAVQEFKESYRLSRNPVLLYNIGWSLDESGDKRMALFYYEKFLSDASEEAPNRDFATRRVREIKRELQADAVFEEGGAPAKPPERSKPRAAERTAAAEPPRPAGPTEFMHTVVDEAPPGMPLDITAFIPDDAEWQVTLFFRAAGESRFGSTVMRPRYNELVGRIPPETMSGRSVQYYIEAKDRAGETVAHSGRATSPNLVLVDEAARPRYYPDLGDDQSWQARLPPPATSRSRTGDGRGGWMDVESDKFRYAKWGSTASAAGFFAISTIAYVTASNYKSALQAEAEESRRECTTPPCRSFSDELKGFESTGRTWQTMANVTMTLGVASAGVAAYFWYKDIKAEGAAQSSAAAPSSGSDRVVATPVVGPDFIGGAASVRF